MEFFHTSISPEAIRLVNQVLNSGWLSEGRMVKEFEYHLNSQLGLINPVALNSGTTALHLALVLAGIGSGDEVILPAQTFVATGLVILMQGATPVFADIDPLTGNISPASISAKITERTRAIIPVHWGGYPCDMDEINALAAQYNLVVIEDAAHALGATYHGYPIGAISRFTAFSFQAIKHLTTGDGGALACLELADAQQALTRRWFGIDRTNSQPSVLGERVYDVTDVGYKYHMNDFAAALGIGNLVDFQKRLERRQALGAYYCQELACIPGLKLPPMVKDRSHAYWLFTVLVEQRENFIRKLASDDIPASVVHLRIDHNTIFGGIRTDLPGQEIYNQTQVSIPVHEGLTDENAHAIMKSIQAGW